ncbi:CD0519/CD1768 family membrane protein [Guggenheimella bovis]
MNKRKRALSLETIVFLIIFVGFFTYFSCVVGGPNMLNIMMQTSYHLLLETVFFIMAIAVLAGAIGALLTEFGVVHLINIFISPIMRPLYGLPGAASVGALTTYLSDNPAIIPLANNKNFRSFFKDYEIPSLCNLGTGFGMGLILSTYMIGIRTDFLLPTLVGNLGAIIGSVVSVRIMLHFTKKFYNATGEKRKVSLKLVGKEFKENFFAEREVPDGSVFERALNAILNGGQSGVEMGLAIIPGVLFICTIVLILTFGPSVDPQTGAKIYKGVAYEGIELLPKLGKIISPVTNLLFGFTSPEAISFPITSLGAVGAAMALVPKLLQQNLIGPNDIAVFTAMGMCWSGYLSTHVSMMDALHVRELTGKAILSHTIGGLCAGISAHFLFLLFTM